MSIPPNHKKLIIPQKTSKKAHPTYKDDMRTIEMWANDQSNEGGVQQLIAGTNITLSPTNGEGVVTINSTGGGGGTKPGAWTLTAGPDFANVSGSSPFGLPFSGMSNGSSGAQLISEWLTTPPSSGFQEWTFTSSWLWNVFGGQSASILPILQAPAFTGVATISVYFTLYALSPALLGGVTDGATYQTLAITFASGASHQITAAQFSVVVTAPSGDLTLTAGSGATGNGLVSTAGSLYFGAAQANVLVPAACVFT